MDQNIKKYRKIETFINKIEFKEIKLGSLLAQTLELNYYDVSKPSFFKNLLILFKYSVTLPLAKPKIEVSSDFIFTKLTNRFHFNELIDPLILNYLNISTIVCDEKSFDPQLVTDNQIFSRSIMSKQTIANSRGDAIRIIQTTFKVLLILSYYRKKLEISCNDITFFSSTLLIQLRRVSYWDEYFKKSVIKPKCIITEFDRNSLSSPLILSAKKHNILTITLTHGVIFEYGFTPVLADRIFCWGKLQKKQLMSMGLPSNRISITGNPMLKAINHNPNEVYKTSNDFTICLAISPEADNINKSLIEPFVHAVEKLQHVKGIIKLHPSLSKGSYKWINSISSKVVIVESSEISNNKLFDIIDLLIVHFSGIANEALAVGIPVIVMQVSGTSILNLLQRELNQTAGCKIARNEKELIEILEEVIINPNLFKSDSAIKSKKYLENLFETIGEESIQAMISEIDRLTGEVITNKD